MYITSRTQLEDCGKKVQSLPFIVIKYSKSVGANPTKKALNMKKIVYHCSPDLISKFDFRDGVHFGGLTSALEAGSRKFASHSMDKRNENLYVHRCVLEDTPTFISEDVGHTLAWFDVADRAEDSGYSVIEYRNKYEPDVHPSYYVLDGSLIHIKDVEVYSYDEAMDALDHLMCEHML